MATTADGQGTVSALLSRADENLYAAKRAGRDRVATDGDAGRGRDGSPGADRSR